jgi:Xaa-Pro dipeptidase
MGHSVPHTGPAAGVRHDAGEAPPFPEAELRRRLETARARMADVGVDVLLLFDPQNVYFFTGYSSVNLWDPACAVVALEGPVRVVLWEFEVPRFEMSAGLGEAVAYRSPAELISVLSGVLDPSMRTYGCDEWTPFPSPKLFGAVTELLDGRGKRDVRPVVCASRLRKSPAELQVLEEAAGLTEIGLNAAVDAIATGVKDHEVAAAASAAMLASGSEHFCIQPIVAVGPRAGVPHSAACGRTISSGETVFLELGACVKRYTTPVMRTVVVGDPSREVERLASLAGDVMHRHLESMRPGVLCSEVARAANEIVRSDGILFHGVHGYPVGIGFPPSWIENLLFWIDESNTARLEEGMVFHIPLSLRHRAVRGVGLSYTLVIEQEGPRVLNGSAAELIAK